MQFIHNLGLRQKLMVLVGLLLLVTAVLAFTQWKVNHARQEVAQAYQQRYSSSQLANEVRRNSDHLTRLVRTYVDTGDARWEKQYNELLDIRAGKVQRPAGYSGLYWDFRAADIALPGQPEPAAALLDMMRKEGFTDAEMAKLSESADRSAALVSLEQQAMNLVKGLVPDGKGGFVPGEVDRDKARELVNSADYHRTKAQIMEPVNDFYRMLNARTDLHITRLHEAVSAGRQIAEDHLASMTQRFADYGDAARSMALAVINQRAHKQALIMAFGDIFLGLTVIFCLLVLMAVFMQKPKPAPAGAGGGH